MKDLPEHLTTLQHNYLTFWQWSTAMDDTQITGATDEELQKLTRVSMEGNYVDLEDSLAIGERIHEHGRQN